MKKILVIDYDQNALASLQSILTKEGYLVVTAGDGQAGWDKYNKEAPDLVLLEAMLPKVHGFELCQRITSERNSQATVFIMTGVYKDRVYRTEALRTYGASEYFEKPLKMAEVLASVEAVLGKPETKPAEPKSAPAGPEPVLIDPRKIEWPKAGKDDFALPPDLDILRREVPKVKSPAPARREAPAAAGLESLADELLKTVIAEPSPSKAVEEKPQEHKGNGHENIDIDQMLKSALADFHLEHEKVKVPKTAPLPPPPPPVVEKTKPAPPPPVAVKPKPVPPPPPAFEKPAAEMPKPAPTRQFTERPKAVPGAPPAVPPAAFSQPAPSGTISPGDPGSDASPFFTPDKTKPAKPRDISPAPSQFRPGEKPKAQTPPPLQFAAPPVSKPPKAEERAERKPAPAPAAAAEPARPETKAPGAGTIVPSQVFADIIEERPKKGFSPLIAAGVGVAAIAVIGFFILRPKQPAAALDDGQKTPQTVVQSNIPEQPAAEPPPPVEKSKPAAPKPRVETQTKVADIGPSSEEAILLPAQPVTEPPRAGGQAATGNKAESIMESVPVQVDQPAAKTEENPPQSQSGGDGTAGSPEAPAATPAAPPVNEGDLVDLASVDEQPRTLKTVDPVYPASAQRLGVEGSVTVNALIDEKGSVIDTGILKGLKDDRGLIKAAETAVKKWKFQPAQKGGVKVKVWKPFVIVFKAVRNSA